MRLIDVDATIKYLEEFICKDCDRRKGMKNGKIVFCYEIGDAPCRSCDIGDTIDYFLDEDISPTVDAVTVVRCKDCKISTMEKVFKNVPTSKEQVRWCDLIQRYVDDDWYCADGVKRE